MNNERLCDHMLFMHSILVGKVVPTPSEDHFLEKLPNCHILLLTKIWTISRSIKHTVIAGKVHLPIKSIEKMFIFGPYLRNRVLFQKSAK